MSSKIQKSFANFAVALALLFFASSAMAQPVQVSGRCITGTINLTVDAGSPLNGKVWYSGFGTVLGFPGVNVNLYWDSGVSRWYLDFDGQAYFENADNTTLPPSTNVGTWVPTGDNSDCLTGAPLSIAGSGTGDREINVKQNTTNIADGGSFNYGNVNIGSNDSKVFTIENTGTLTLNLTGTPPNYVTKGGTNPGDFTITQPATGTIAASSSTTFTVLFTPGGPGARSCTLQIPNNDANKNPYDITLNGTGVCSTPACSITFTNPPPWGGDSTCANTTGNVYSAPGGMSAYNWSISGQGTITSGTTGSSVTVTAGNSGSYSLSLTVTDANGCTSACSDQTPIKPSPTCSLSGSSTVCSGSTGNVYSVDNGVFPISSYSWNISGNGTIVGPTNGSSVTVTAGASGSYTLSVTSVGSNACPSTCSQMVTINSSSTPTITGPTTVCSGGSVMLDAGAGYTSYAWSDGGGSGQTATFSNITMGTTYSVTVTGSNGCTGTDTHTVSVNAPPACNVTGADYVCNNSPGNMYTAPPGMTSYNWGISGNGSIPGVTNGQSVSVTSGGYTLDYTVFLTVTDANGCTSSCSKQSFIFLEKPLADITVNPNPACFGVAFDLSVAAAASSTVAWTGEGIANPNGNPSTTALPASTGLKTYSVIITADNGCSNTDEVEVTVENCNIDFSGKIIFSNNNSLGVNNATVSLTGSATGSDVSDTNGDFSISTALTLGSFTLKPTKTTNKLNGVTVGDVTAIQQHVANINLIADLYKLVAADVNKSNSVTTTDASIVNQALLGNPTALAQFNTSWRFVPTSHTMSNPPWGFPEQRAYVNISGPQTNQDFYGIKTGDVVTAFANPANFGASEHSGLVLNVQDQVLEPGKEITVGFGANQLNDLAAFQFALKFDVEKLGLTDISPAIGGSLPLTADNFGTFNIGEGEIRAAWSQAGGIFVEEGASAFLLKFNVLEGGSKLSEVLYLDESELSALAYNTALKESKVELKFNGLTSTGDPASASGLQLFQNRPNPFVGRTAIAFVLPESCEAKLRIFDVSGKILAEKTAQYAAGRHEEIFDLADLTGVLWYELTTPFGILTKKMVAAQ
jgi:hypothetical protein